MSQLRCYFNWLALDGLGPFGDGPVNAIHGAGYNGIQFIDPVDRPALEQARAIGLGVCGSARVNQLNEADSIALATADDGLECLTLHVGWGMESEDEGARLIESILEAGARHHIPLYVETHRATLFQDMYRAVQFTRQFPELRFNGDFSHWYTGLEMVYGGFEKKVAFIQPVIERVRFLHGRIGNPGCMQVPVDPNGSAPYIDHFRTIWTECFAAYLRQPVTQQPFITFAVELLAPEIYYARTFAGAEESDRWEESLVIANIARECFQEAKRTVASANK